MLHLSGGPVLNDRLSWCSSDWLQGPGAFTCGEREPSSLIWGLNCGAMVWWGQLLGPSGVQVRLFSHFCQGPDLWHWANHSSSLCLSIFYRSKIFTHTHTLEGKSYKGFLGETLPLFQAASSKAWSTLQICINIFAPMILYSQQSLPREHKKLKQQLFPFSAKTLEP